MGRIGAVDWSGRRSGAARYIWLAEACDGRLVRLECGRDREQMGDELVRMALHDPGLVIGLDFAFSFPLWFLDQHGIETALDLDSAQLEAWLSECPPPFWGRPGRPRGREPQLRETERELPVQPKSIFQTGGAGAVGTASLRGFALLRRLRREGFAIWPLDPARPPVAVEIYPRLFTWPVVKSRREERESYLRRCRLPVEAAVTEDAFDAAVSVQALHDRVAGLAGHPAPADPTRRREGEIVR
jgi:hypothetical protein